MMAPFFEGAEAVPRRQREVLAVVREAEHRRRRAYWTAAGARLAKKLATQAGVARGRRVIERVHQELVGDGLDARDQLVARADLLLGEGGTLEDHAALVVVGADLVLVHVDAPGEVLLEGEDASGMCPAWSR